MSYNILPTPPFDKQLKRLTKKYSSPKVKYLKLVEEIEETPEIGTKIGNNCYKIRLTIVSKGKGKSGGARIITNIVVTAKTVYLLSIYDKSEKENLTDKELTELLKLVDK